MNKNEFRLGLHQIIELELYEEIQSILKDYIDYLIEEKRIINYDIKNFYGKIRRLILAFRQVEKQNLGWEHCCELIVKSKNYNINIKNVRGFYHYLYSNGILNDEYSEYLRINPGVLSEDIIGSRFVKLYKNLVPENFYVKFQNNKAMYFNLNIKSEFLRSILIDLLLLCL